MPPSDSAGHGLPRIEPRVLRREVLAAIRAAILSGEIPPGSRLLEADLASRMGVSRAPVREAVRQLEQEGLVESFVHRGAVVIGLPEDEVEAIFEMRALIEGKAMERACIRATEADLARLVDCLVGMDAALARRDLDEVAELDLRFHGAIMEISGLSLLRRIWSSLDGLVRVRSYQALERETPESAHFLEDSVASHERLIDALRQRKPLLAAERIREHILEVPHRMHGEPPPSPRR